MKIENKGKPGGYKPHIMSMELSYWNGDEDVPVELEFSIKCYNCASDWLRKDGAPTEKKKQMYECKECGSKFQYDKRYNRCHQLFQICRMLNKNYSQVEIAREVKIHHSTVKKYINQYNLRDVYRLPGFQLPIRELLKPQDKQYRALFNHCAMVDYFHVLMKYYDYDYRQVME